MKNSFIALLSFVSVSMMLVGCGSSSREESKTSSALTLISDTHKLYTPGDINKDGKVNSADVTLLNNRDFFNSDKVATWEDGDFNNDKLVDQLDVALLSTYFHKVSGDINGDGVVDITDASLFNNKGFYGSGMEATWEDGDFNGDLVVDQYDSEILIRYFNQ